MDHKTLVTLLSQHREVYDPDCLEHSGCQCGWEMPAEIAARAVFDNSVERGAYYEHLATAIQEKQIKVYALWNGGPNYRQSNIWDGDLEVFDSIEAARSAFISRAEDGHHFQQEFKFADGRTQTVFCPVVEDSQMRVYFSKPEGDDEPDLVFDRDDL